MSIDRDLLRKISEKTHQQQSGIASLSRGIHRLPDLRDWVTFETIALPPIPAQRLGDWGLISLLAVRKKNSDGIEGYATPWAVVEWSLGTMTVVRKTDLRSIKASDPLWVSKVIVDRPADLSINLTVPLRILRENALFTSLDEFCSNATRTQADFTELAKHYAGIIPQEIYAYYHDLVPESKSWLRADLPAINLESISAPQGLATEQNQKKHPDETANLERPKIPLQLPRDLTDRLANWLRQSADINNALATENREIGEQMSALLKNIHNRQLLPGFRLAFVGEFSRGKSCLINHLLDRNILPEGTLPTTATLTSIVAGAAEQMEVRIGGKTEIRSLEEASWEELLATDLAGSDREVFAGVRITIDHEWLQSLDLEIIDTPGAGDLNDKRANLVLDLLNQCDAAVLLVSATSPFSMTEAAFLEQEVIGRHVPRIIVAVSKLDTIVANEREKVFQNIAQRIAKVSSDIPVLATYPIDQSSTESTTLSNLMTQIESLVDRGERRIWRSRQVSQQISDWLDRSIEMSQAAILSIQMDAEERERQAKQVQIKLEKADIDWINLQVEVDRRRLKRAKEIRQKVFNIQEELLENLEFEIQKVTDLKEWWERDLPFRLRRELTIISRNVENLLVKFLAEDIDWLQHHLKTIFATNIKPQSPAPQTDRGIDFALNDREIVDVQKYRLFTRLGSTAAIIGGSIVGGPIGIAASTGVLIMSEQYLNQELDKQREVLVGDLRRVVDISLDRYCQEIADRLRQLYQSTIADLENERATWIFSKKVALNVDKKEREQNWQQIINKSQKLQQEIAGALSH